MPGFSSNSDGQSIMFARNADFSRSDSADIKESHGLVQNGQLWIGRTSLNSGGTHIDVGTLTAGTGMTVTNGPGTITLATTASLTDYHWPKFIVGDTANGANYSTITAALASASSGDTIALQPGTYTENITLKAGVNIVGLEGDAYTPNVTILGKCSYSGAGTVTISSVELKTNSDFFLVVSGSSASRVNLVDCYLNCNNNTGISYTSSGSANILVKNCLGTIGTTGITLFVSTSTGGMNFIYTTIGNAGSTTTSSSTSSGAVSIQWSTFGFPISTSSTGQYGIYYSQISTISTNTTAITTAGTGSVTAVKSFIESGSASAVSIGTGTLASLISCIVSSTNTNPVTGLGTYSSDATTYNNTGVLPNPTTEAFVQVGRYGTFTPTLDGAVSGTTTYTSQVGQYHRIGNLVWIQGTIVITAATGTGNVIIGGLPFTIKNVTNGGPTGAISASNAAWAWPAGVTSFILLGVINTTTCQVLGNGTSINPSQLQMTNGAMTMRFSMVYEV